MRHAKGALGGEGEKWDEGIVSIPPAVFILGLRVIYSILGPSTIIYYARYRSGGQ